MSTFEQAWATEEAATGKGTLVCPKCRGRKAARSAKVCRQCNTKPLLRYEVDQGSGCWLWTGYRNKCGYGTAWYKGSSTLAHRVSWELRHGPITNGLQVLHRCDNPPCVNPDHLFLGTHQDNMRDATTKGRMAAGERNGSKTKPESRPRGESHYFSRHPEMRMNSSLKGERNGMARLTAEQVKEIRRQLSSRTRADIAKSFDITVTMVGRIARRVAWSHLEG